MVSVRTNIGVGDEFLGYRIDEVIGQGGMGIVYRAYDLRLRRVVALKLVTPELALDERFRQRFARETELAMSLEHPNVVPIYDAGDMNGRLYLAMRLVAGTDLRRLLRAEGALEPSRALAICGQLAGALDAAHANGLVHRDVKPSNVLLDESEHVYLADFGLTRRTDEQGAQAGDGRSIGTPAYLAPEQIEGKPVDGRADVYALGCLLFECLTGAPPYAGGSRLAVAWGHLEEEPPSVSGRNSELPQTLDPVLSKALAKEPDDRYPTCAALIAAAAEALGLSKPPAHRSRRLALGAAAAIVVLIAAAIAALLATRGGGAPQRAALFARKNTLARIDPATNNVSDVIAVGDAPFDVAAAGGSAWVYNAGDGSVTQVDAATDTVRHTVALHAIAVGANPLAGPVVAADRGGVWFVGVSPRGSLLVRVRPDGRKRLFRLDHPSSAVAVAFDSVWVVGKGNDNQLIRIDPATGRVTGRTHFGSAPIDSIGVGAGAVWVVGSSNGMLYRIDPHTGRRTGHLDVGTNASRPAISPSYVEVVTSDHRGTNSYIDPHSMTPVSVDTNCQCPPDWGINVWANGWWWSYGWPTGDVYRQQSASNPIREIRVGRTSPGGNGPCLTSIAAGAGAVWVTAAANHNLTCGA